MFELCEIENYFCEDKSIMKRPILRSNPAPVVGRVGLIFYWLNVEC